MLNTIIEVKKHFFTMNPLYISPEQEVFVYIKTSPHKEINAIAAPIYIRVSRLSDAKYPIRKIKEFNIKGTGKKRVILP